MTTVQGTNNPEIIDHVDGVTSNGDTIFGFGGNDIIFGLGGRDWIKGGGGADMIIGGVDGDTALYGDSPVGVTVSLMTGRGHGGTAEGDTLITIEHLTGSAYNDTLIGNEGGNEVDGGAGDDTLWGNGGGDFLLGQGGSDTLKGGGGFDILDGGGHDDVLFGLEDDDILKGGGGADMLDGGLGADTMRGGSGDDTYIVDDYFDVVTESGGTGFDMVLASASWNLTEGADIEVLATPDDDGTAHINLIGNSSGNVVRGNNGNNDINGLGGNDELIGGGGTDSFVFNTPLDAAFNVDVIVDFNVADDRIRLDDAIFSSSLGLGNISAGEFVIGAAAQDANDRIIYDSISGALFYDSDGAGGTAATQFAELSTGLALTNLDFFVV